MTEPHTPREYACLTLFIPIARATPAELARRLGDGFTLSPDGTKLRGAAMPFDVDVEWLEPSREELAEAFSFGTCSEDQVRAISAAPRAIVVHVPGELHWFGASIARLAHALHDAGALAFRLEQSKAGYAAEDWLRLIDHGGAASFHRLAVVGLRGEDEARTIGMRVFGSADFEIEASGAVAQRWLQSIALYQIDEDPLFGSGHTFAPDADTQRRMMEWWPDAMYPSDHPCHNPFGVLRMGPPVERGRPQSKLVMNFIPPLFAMLAAAREEKGAPLTAEEVTTMRDDGACIAMDPKHQRELARSRGYADLDPERAAVCWEVIERTMFASG